MILNELQHDSTVASPDPFSKSNPISIKSITFLKSTNGTYQIKTLLTFNNHNFKITYAPVNLSDLNRFNDGDVVTPELLKEMGSAMAAEAKFYDVSVILGPGVNIKRNPRCGRNFEYFSEDPFLAGRMGAEEVKGIQEKGIGVSVKHFAGNNSENYRFMGDSVIDERALREIYLRQFEYIVKEAKPETLMCAYNKINGTHCSENEWLLNEWLLNEVLRKEWGFNGLVMSDWGTTHDRIKGIKSGLDLEMPGDNDICRKWIVR